MKSLPAIRICLRALLLLLAASAAAAAESAAEPVEAPPLVATDLDGNAFRLSDHAGRVLVVNFWASWCAPCRAELPSMNRAVDKLRQAPVTWLGANVGEDREAVAAFVTDFAIEFTVLLDPDGELSQRWEVTGMPTTFVVDRDGYIAHKIVGEREWDDARHLQLILDLVDR